MTLRPCRSCSHQVDRSATKCPNCGARKPGRGFVSRHPILTLMIIGGVAAGISNNISSGMGTLSEAEPVTVPQDPAVAQIDAWVTGWSERQAAEMRRLCEAAADCTPTADRPETSFGWAGTSSAVRTDDWARGPRYNVVANGRPLLVYLEGGAVVSVYSTAGGGRNTVCTEVSC